MTKKLIFKLLLEQFISALSIPLSNKVITDPVSFFVVSNACHKKSELLITSINFSEQIIIDAISEISAGSAASSEDWDLHLATYRHTGFTPNYLMLGARSVTAYSLDA